MSSSPPQPVRFGFTQGHSEVYGSILRPGAKVYIRTARATWLPHFMLVDSGADYTLLPRTIGEFLGFRKDIADKVYRAGGVGGGDIWVRFEVRFRQKERLTEFHWRG